jgi:hypothetical protein
MYFVVRAVPARLQLLDLGGALHVESS